MHTFCCRDAKREAFRLGGWAAGPGGLALRTIYLKVYLINVLLAKAAEAALQIWTFAEEFWMASQNEENEHIKM